MALAGSESLLLAVENTLELNTDTSEITDIVQHLDSEEQELVAQAYWFAKQRHANQKRLSGDPYIVHLLATAKILAQYGLDGPTLATAFMHDLIEEGTGTTLEELAALFGKEIASLVEGVTKLTSLFSRQERAVQRISDRAASGHEAAVENLRRIFLAMARDLRVILVKLADRLHNLRTFEFVAPEIQTSIARETLDVFTPIASRLGIWEFKAELEDLAFRYAYPKEYHELSTAVEASRTLREQVMVTCVAEVQKRLDEMGIDATIEYRTKHLYSIYKKLNRTGKSLYELYDLTAMRVIVNTLEECYSVFGAVHALWSPVNGRIKDYIARPKANNYRSLHTTVYGPNEQLVEIQIRTAEMHHINEVGIAAHWAYKEGRKVGGTKNARLFSELYPWIRALLTWHGDGHDSSDYASHLKVDLLAKEVFVFTPRGEVVDLPSGSNPIDFAYRIHTEVGHRCVGALVNKKMVPLTYKLKNADVVEIQTSKNGTPSRDWLRICASHSAIIKIRAWFKKERREENIVRGRDMLRRELARTHQEEVGANETLMQQVANGLNFVSVDDLLASIGYGETTPNQVLGRLNSLRAASAPALAEVPALPVRTTKHAGPGRNIIVKGMDSILTKFARCCAPVPGDTIIGYVSVGKGVSVHRLDCTNMGSLAERHPERVIEVQWNEDLTESGRYQVQLAVSAWDRSGLVSDVAAALNDMHIPVKGCQAWTSKEQAGISLLLEVADKRQMEDTIGRLRQIKGVFAVGRARRS